MDILGFYWVEMLLYLMATNKQRIVDNFPYTHTSFSFILTAFFFIVRCWNILIKKKIINNIFFVYIC